MRSTLGLKNCSNISDIQGYFQAFVPTTVFYWSKIEFFRERNKFSVSVISILVTQRQKNVAQMKIVIFIM